MLNSIKKFGWWDIVIMTTFIICTNGHLLNLNSPYTFLLTIEGLEASQFYRFITHPFLHISWYHLALDGVAFFFLYTMISKVAKERLLIFFIALAGSVIGALWGTEGTLPQGLCGLSGVAHGIIIWISLSMMKKEKQSWERWLGAGSLLFTLVKSLYEIYTGEVFFASLHTGNVGTPVVSCHFGSVVMVLLFGGFGWLQRAIYHSLISTAIEH